MHQENLSEETRKDHLEDLEEIDQEDQDLEVVDQEDLKEDLVDLEEGLEDLVDLKKDTVDLRKGVDLKKKEDHQATLRTRNQADLLTDLTKVNQETSKKDLAAEEKQLARTTRQSKTRNPSHLMGFKIGSNPTN